MIKPTIGRKVWYWPGVHGAATFNILDEKQPLDATVIYVHNDRSVNLLVVDHVGQTHDLRGVVLAQPEDDREKLVFSNQYAGLAEWMPYQVGAARPDQTRSQSQD